LQLAATLQRVAAFVLALNAPNKEFSAFAFAAGFFEQLDLNLRDLKESIAFGTAQQVINFFVQMPNFELVCRAQPIAGFSAVLTHDNWRLNGSETDRIKLSK
jgi:hypothetical protein